jgi:hypothetical protein
MFLQGSSRLIRKISLKNKILHYSKLSSCAKQTYAEVFQASVKNRDEFWAEQAEKVTWTKKWDKVLDDSNSPFTKWQVQMRFVVILLRFVTSMYVS